VTGGGSPAFGLAALQHLGYIRGMNEYTMLANQRASVSQPPLADLQRQVLTWLHTEAGFAQVYTVNQAGYPLGLTMAAPVDDEFTVWLVQRKVHKRIDRWRRNPKTEVVWMGAPAPGSRNDSPHTYDLNLAIPRGVFIRGDAEFLDDATLVERFQQQTALHRSRGWTKAPERTVENIVSELVGVRIRPLQVRVEGFGDGAASFTWKPEWRK
jgi:hypothetical protein